MAAAFGRRGREQAIQRFDLLAHAGRLVNFFFFLMDYDNDVTMTRTRKLKVLIAAHTGKSLGGVSTNSENLPRSSLREMVDRRFVETSAWRPFTRAGYWSLENIISALTMMLQFKWALLRNLPDVVNIGSAHAGSFMKHSLMVLLSRLWRRKVVIMLHCGYRALLVEAGRWQRYVLFILRQCQRVIVISREWMPLEGMLPPGRVVYIPDGIDLTPFLSMPLDRFAGREEMKLLYLGHNGQEKGSYDLAGALRIAENDIRHPYRVNILGEEIHPGDRQRLVEQVHAHGLDAKAYINPPEFAKAKLRRLYDADIYLLPSHSEGMPISVIEALVSGLPLIATRVGGISDIVDDGQNGLLVPWGDAPRLAKALSSLINNAALRREMAARASNTANERFDIQLRVKRLYDLYTSLVHV